jgi:hypothetical protein
MTQALPAPEALHIVRSESVHWTHAAATASQSTRPSEREAQCMFSRHSTQAEDEPPAVRQ